MIVYHLGFFLPICGMLRYTTVLNEQANSWFYFSIFVLSIGNFTQLQSFGSNIFANILLICRLHTIFVKMLLLLRTVFFNALCNCYWVWGEKQETTNEFIFWKYLAELCQRTCDFVLSCTICCVVYLKYYASYNYEGMQLEDNIGRKLSKFVCLLFCIIFANGLCQLCFFIRCKCQVERYRFVLATLH